MLTRPLAEVGLVRLSIDVGGVSRVSDHHRRAVVDVDEDALVANRVPRRGHHAHAVRDLRVAVEQLEARPGEVEPLRRGVILFAGARELRTLDVERRVLEDGVLPAVIEVKVTVDHDPHVGRTEVVLGQHIGGVAVHDLPFVDQLGRPTHAGVDQNRAGARVLDHESMDRHVVERVDAGQVEADYLQSVRGRMARRRRP